MFVKVTYIAYSPTGRSTEEEREFPPYLKNMYKYLRKAYVVGSLLVARVKLEPESSSSHEPSSSQGPTLIFLSFFFLFMSYGCYSLFYSDVPVVNGKNNFHVCNIFRYRSLEPLLL